MIFSFAAYLEKRAQTLADRQWSELLREIRKRSAAAEDIESTERTSSEEIGGEYATLEEVSRVSRLLRELLERNPCSLS